MRRLTACALTVGLAWLLVTRLGSESGNSAALALGVALLAAAIVGWLAEFARLPRVTGYLAFGLVCGPSMANIITEPMARDLQAASGFAVVVIAVIAGLHVNFRTMAPRLSLLAGLAGAALAVTWGTLAVVTYVAWPWLPIAPHLSAPQRLMACGLAATLLIGTSPAVTIAIITEGRARGPLSTLASEVAVLTELFCVATVMILLEASRMVFDLESSATALVGNAAWALIGSAAFGALMGGLFTLYLRHIGREVTLVLLAVCAVLSGMADPLGFEPFLAGLTAGLVVQNVQGHAGTLLHDAIEYGAMPVLVLFFAVTGAALHIEVLATVGALAVVLSLIRIAALRAGTRFGIRVTGIKTPGVTLLWRGLVPTAGITLGLAAMVASSYPEWGMRLQTVIVAVVALNQLAGPILFRAALAQIGEVGRAGGSLVVASNREPWMHERAPDGTIKAIPTPGGVSVALDALMRERGGVWIAHGAGSADRLVVDEQSSIEVPPEAPAYRLRRLWLTREQIEGYYTGFANSGLWPLCHQAHVRPVFRGEDWEAYQEVNRMFAEAAAVEAPIDASVFLNDYHLSLVARDLRALRPALRTALFWHIPWPDIDRLRICPWRRELLEGLLSNDLLAFQVPRDQRNFLNAASEELGAAVSGETVFMGDRPVRVLSIPIGADFDRISEILAEDTLGPEMQRLSGELGLAGHVVGIGVDRLDYTKGIPERLAAIGRLLREQPHLARNFLFVQIGVPSRTQVHGYAEIEAEIETFTERVNQEFGTGSQPGPILYLKESFRLPQLVALYRLADFCIVSSLHDGMNLVAKEFVASRDDLDGVLILSELAGAAQELSEALIINPYDERGFTAAIARAIEMPGWERRRRMQALRRRVAGRDVLAWASDILDRLERRKGSGFLSG
ncbi:MAG: trehalose-6-phosphate synthase [Vicinamibacterales bacterium]